MDWEDRAEEDRGQGKERERDQKRRNGRVHRERTDSSAVGKAKQEGDKRKVLSEANTKGGNSSERIYGWKRGRDRESQRSLGLTAGG